MKKLMRLFALVMVAALLLTGCTMADLKNSMDDAYTSLMTGVTPSFDEMEYTRPEMDVFRQQLEVCMTGADTIDDADALMEEIYLLYEIYYSFYTNYNLADIRYCIDMTDVYWDQEYNWCMENSSEIDAGMDQLLYTLAECPLKEELETYEFFGADFFDEYQGESLWDETFTALMDRENELLSEYYTLNAQSAEVEYYSEEFFAGYGVELEEVFVELIGVRQEIAEYAGYDNYPEFAYDFYYYRDYTPAQAESYMAEIQTELTPLYGELESSLWSAMYETCTEAEIYAYTRECAQSVGGVAENAFELMEAAELYDITYSQNKYDASFETYLYDYYVPFVYMSPYGMEMDKLTFTHEFGHFCNDYASGGSAAGVDVAEIFSQGLEYLSLEYCAEGEALKKSKMADSLCTFVEQSAYAAFEHQVYSLEGDDLTVENVRALFKGTMDAYGVSAYEQAYVLVPHFYIAPMYVISYVVSNDAAMQIYQAELAQSGHGKALWEGNLDTMESYFLAFLEEAGLDSPFAPGRVQELRVTFEDVLR